MHVGCQKTGTTTLQMHLYKKLDPIYYIGKYSDHKFFKDPIRAGIEGSAPLPAIREQWEDQVDTAPADTETVLHSWESMTLTHLDNQYEVAKRLRDIVGDAKILITIRRQQDICISQFFNFVSQGWLNKDDFDSFLQRGLEFVNSTEYGDTTRIIPVSFYNKKVESYSQVFHCWQFAELLQAWSQAFDTVMVLPLEAWKEQPELTKETLANFLSIPVEEVEIPSKKARTRTDNFRRIVGRKLIPGYGIAPRKVSFIKRWVRSGVPEPIEQFIKRRYMDIELTADQLSAIEDTYEQSNRKLEVVTDFDLAELGYPGLK